MSSYHASSLMPSELADAVLAGGGGPCCHHETLTSTHIGQEGISFGNHCVFSQLNLQRDHSQSISVDNPALFPHKTMTTLACGMLDKHPPQSLAMSRDDHSPQGRRNTGEAPCNRRCRLQTDQVSVCTGSSSCPTSKNFGRHAVRTT